MIYIIDLGISNLHSVFKAFIRLGAETEIITSPKSMETSDKIVLPGVGHFKKGMERLKKTGFDSFILEVTKKRKTPILGICLGMQLLTSYSEEGDTAGLNIIDAKTIHFKNLNLPTDLKIPHIGWNNITNSHNSDILKGTNNEFFYFVHSYAVQCNDPGNIICETEYGVKFHSGIRKDNIFGLQFHPEKSHKAGLQILKNYLDI